MGDNNDVIMVIYVPMAKREQKSVCINSWLSNRHRSLREGHPFECSSDHEYLRRIGGESDPRNKALMKMINLINIGERAGSGVPNIFNGWADEGWEEPVIEEVVDVKTSRIKVLLTELQEQNLAESSGNTKGKMYRKVVE